MRRTAVLSALIVATAIAVDVFTGPTDESAPDDSIARGMTFTHQYLDGWGKDHLPQWKVVLKRYASSLGKRSDAAIVNLLDPADKTSLGRVDSVVSKFAASSSPGIKAKLEDLEQPGYSRFCLRFPDGASQEVFVTYGVPGGSEKRWVLRFDDESTESC